MFQRKHSGLLLIAQPTDSLNILEAAGFPWWRSAILNPIWTHKMVTRSSKSSYFWPINICCSVWTAFLKFHQLKWNLNIMSHWFLCFSLPMTRLLLTVSIMTVSRAPYFWMMRSLLSRTTSEQEIWAAQKWRTVCKQFQVYKCPL